MSIERPARARQGGIVVGLQAVFHAALFAILEEVVMGRGGGVVFGAGEAMDAYEANTSGCSFGDQYLF